MPVLRKLIETRIQNAGDRRFHTPRATASFRILPITSSPYLPATYAQKAWPTDMENTLDHQACQLPEADCVQRHLASTLPYVDPTPQPTGIRPCPPQTRAANAVPGSSAAAHRTGPRCNVELKRMDQFMTENMIRVRQRSRQSIIIRRRRPSVTPP